MAASRAAPKAAASLMPAWAGLRPRWPRSCRSRRGRHADQLPLGGEVHGDLAGGHAAREVDVGERVGGGRGLGSKADAGLLADGREPGDVPDLGEDDQGGELAHPGQRRQHLDPGIGPGALVQLGIEPIDQRHQAAGDRPAAVLARIACYSGGVQCVMRAPALIAGPAGMSRRRVLRTGCRQPSPSSKPARASRAAWRASCRQRGRRA